MIQKLLIALCLICVVDPALAAGRGYFGAWFGELPESEKVVQTGVIVKKVYAGMAAQRAGLREGEIITRINGVLASDPPTAVELLAENTAGEKVRLTVVDRNGGGFRSFDVFAIMGDKPTAEFLKLKKSLVRCPSQDFRLCAPSGKTPAQHSRSDGHGTNTYHGWLLFVFFAVPACALLVKKIWRFKRSGG